MKHKIYILLMLLGMWFASGVHTAHALISNGASATVTCTGWINGSGSFTFNRNNSGGGLENIEVFARDGAGTGIFSVLQGFPVGSTVNLATDELWFRAPRYNPITFGVTSLAGGGFDAQTIIIAVGNCPGLSTYTPPASEAALMAGPPAPNLSDGRINNVPGRDVAAPVALYCTAGDTIDVYSIDAHSGKGDLVIRFAKDGEAKQANRLIDSAGGISVSLLTTGEYQVNAAYSGGKPYVFVWTGCGETKYHLAW